MKKVLTLILSLLMLTLLFCGCGGKADTVTVEFEANATTGYHWEYECSEDGIVKIEGEYVTDDNPKGFVGVGGKQIYTVTAVKEGTVNVTFKYLPPASNDPGKVNEYTFEVDKDLNIKQTKP